jgi:lipopolysaccharide biosynthesis glycosyltransferase
LRRAIYLEGDTLVNGSLKELWEMDLGETALAAGVIEQATAWAANAVKDLMTLDTQGNWVLVQVLLMDFDRFRAFQMPQKTIDLLIKHNGRINLTNEAVINYFCIDLIAPIPRRFNVNAERSVVPDSAWHIRYKLGLPKDVSPIPPVVFHLCHRNCLRPWSTGCTHPARAQWEAYARKTPWELHIVEQKGLLPGDRQDYLVLRFFLRLSHRKDGKLSVLMYCLYKITQRTRYWIKRNITRDPS